MPVAPFPELRLLIEILRDVPPYLYREGRRKDVYTHALAREAFSGGDW